MKIDVIIPCYNYGRYLRDCVRSVLDQQGVDVRALIIDDCSPDNTPEIGRALAAEDSRVEYRRHEKNLRHIATYNEGFEWASADATLLLSADDLLTPGALRRATEVLESHPEVGLVWGEQIVFDQVVPTVQAISAKSATLVLGADLIDQMCRTGSNPVCTPTAIVRMSLVKAIGGYNSALPNTADMHYWLRCAARASVACINAVQAYKRMHGHNMQIAYTDPVLPDLEQRLAAIELFLEMDADLIVNCIHLQQSARAALALEAFWGASNAFDRGSIDLCNQLLNWCRLQDSSLPLSKRWSRFAWKRRLGGRLWGAVRPVVDRFRRQPSLVR